MYVHIHMTNQGLGRPAHNASKNRNRQHIFVLEFFCSEECRLFIFWFTVLLLWFTEYGFVNFGLEKLTFVSWEQPQEGLYKILFTIEKPTVGCTGSYHKH